MIYIEQKNVDLVQKLVFKLQCTKGSEIKKNMYYMIGFVSIGLGFFIGLGIQLYHTIPADSI